MREISDKPKEVSDPENAGLPPEIASELLERYIEKKAEGDAEAASIRDGYGDSIANTIDDIVEGPDKEIQDLWKKYKDEVLIHDPYYDGREAYYDPKTKTVLINIDACRSGKSFESPYQVAFHEFAHNIDYRINGKVNGDGSSAYSETYKNGLLGKTAKKEAADFIENYRAEMEKKKGSPVSVAEACKKISEELTEKIPLMERTDLSDIFEGATNGKINLGVGHGKDYWKTRDNGIEVFAELFSASVCNRGSLNAVREYFPETYKVFKDIVRTTNEQT